MLTASTFLKSKAAGPLSCLRSSSAEDKNKWSYASKPYTPSWQVYKYKFTLILYTNGH